MKKLTALLLALALLAITGCFSPGPGSTSPLVDGELLTVHFIDVGQADCALLEYDGKYMLIDGGNVEDSSLVISYLQKEGVSELEAVFCSHAHEDHVGGLPGVLAVYPTKAVYAPTRTYSSDCFDDFVYYTDQQDLTIAIPQPGDQITLEDLTITVMGPVESYAATNNTSLVLLVEFGQTRFLFTGDMETKAENDMLDYWGEGYNWKVDVLKVGHHGSETSTGYRFLWELMPTYGVISVGAGNSYGHPDELPMSRLQQAGVTLYRTDELGNILATSDGSKITFTWQTGSSPILPDADNDPADTQAPTTTYIGNKNSKKLHVDGCSSLPKAENQVLFDDYDQAIAEGYVPCSKCLG